jgi:hypothetical protein
MQLVVYMGSLDLSVESAFKFKFQQPAIELVRCCTA